MRNTLFGFEAVYIDGANNIEFASTTDTPTTQVYNAGTDGISVNGSVSGLYLEGINVHHNGGKGIILSMPAGSNDSTFIDRSDVHHNGGTGIEIGPGSNGTTVQNTHIYRNSTGLHIRNGANNVRVDHVNAANNANRGLQCDPLATNVRWRNNMVWMNGPGQNAILNECGGTTATNLLDTLDPLYVNASVDNYVLQPASPAIDAGTDLPEIATAYDGSARVQGTRTDIGPYERATPAEPAIPLPMQRARVYEASHFQ
jgi:hypothetical protein